MLDEFENSGDLIFKPNIVLKVHAGINADKCEPNYDLYKKALLCTAKKMIPTYLLCDSICNRTVDPEKLAIMGCRTRVVANVYGEDSSIGRGNIDNISINLPRLALETVKDYLDVDEEQRVLLFKEKWDAVASQTKDILLDRYNGVEIMHIADFLLKEEW